jgi:hypothetical protein
MSWEMLLIWSIVSFGIVTVVFQFRQIAWAKKMNPPTSVTARLIAFYLLPVAAVVLIAIGSLYQPAAIVLAVLALLMGLATPAMGVLYVLSMIETLALVAQFNAVPLEPSKVLGLVCGPFYFQHCIRVIEMHCRSQVNP